MKKLFSFLINSVQIRYALSYMLIIVASVSFLSTFPVIRLRDMMLEGKFVLLQNQAALISSSLSSLTVLFPEDVERVMELLDYSQPMRVLVSDQNGEIVFDSDSENDAIIRPDAAIQTEINKALNGKLVFSSKYNDGELDSYEAQPIIYRNTIIGALYIQQPDNDEAKMIPSLQTDLGFWTVVFLVGTLLLALVFSRIFTNRIFSILRGIKAFQSGAYSYRLDVKGRDEISELGLEFNSLAERLQRTEEVRVRFVSDASHELKTPLAGIRLLADSISNTDDIDPATVKEFVSDISHEAERLTRITERLLELTKLDRATEKPATIFSLKDTVTQARVLLDPLAAQNDVTISDALQDNCTVLADADLIYQAVFNLIENAIKYNRTGGTVSILLYKKEGSAVLHVDDTGVGIAKADLPHIFDRFYRVDKARSQTVGGSGLGLSIAKDAVMKYGGSISASARSGGGTRFTIKLPLNKETDKNE